MYVHISILVYIYMYMKALRRTAFSSVVLPEQAGPRRIVASAPREDVIIDF